MDGRRDERTNESPPVFYRSSSPSGPLYKNAYPSIWAGTVTKKTACNAKKANADRPRDQPTEIAGYIVACTRLKTASFIVTMVTY